MDKRGQVATTATWIVATIAVLVIMLLFLVASGAFGLGALAGFIGEKETKPLNFPEQQQSLFAIVKDPEINSMLLNKNYEQAEKKISPVLDEIKPPQSDGWFITIYEGEEEIQIIKPIRTGANDYQHFITMLNEETKFELYLECAGDVG